MLNHSFKHSEPDSCHDQTLSLHDCIADKVYYANGTLRFELPDGLWITSIHAGNALNKTVKTDAAAVDFTVEKLSDMTVRVFTRSFFGKTKAELWEMEDLIKRINHGECTLEFIYQYRSYFEQMWYCAIHSPRKPYYRECQLHLPKTEATFYWNHLRPECEW